MSTNLSEPQFTEFFYKLNHLSPRQIYRPTYLDIAGFPDRENVWSNLLAFFFKSTNGHGLGNEVFQAFMSLIDVDINHDVVVEATREVSTQDGKYIDLVLVTPNMVVGIENKVNHVLNNDLVAYRNHLVKLANGREVHAFVLSLRGNLSYEGESAGYHFVTYKNFCAKLRKNIDFSPSRLSNKYMMILDDFITSAARTNQGAYMDRDRLAFFQSNLENTETFLDEIVAFNEESRSKVLSLKSLLDRDSLLNNQGGKGGLWHSEKWPTYVLSYTLAITPDLKLNFHILVGASSYIYATVGWCLLIFHVDDNINNRIRLKEWFDARQIRYIEKEEKSGTWRLLIDDPTPPSYDDDIELVSQWFLKWLSKIVGQ
jgi:hypothetical protein